MADAATVKDRIAFLRGLRAVRQFRPEPLPRAVVDDLLAVARWSGSASNRQPWEVVVVRDHDTLGKLAAAEGHAAHLAGAVLAIVIVLANDRPEQEAYDDGRLSERLMLAAEAHGVGSCIGWFTGEGREAVKAMLGIPADRLVRTAISFGYPDEAAWRARPRNEQPRKSLGEIVHFERY
ncbi:MAG TPA: nitroreductase family protein [Thermomicrobiales bacterium]|nr:nitroreductase family protein [Thermomicrobiales bacterium]